MTLRQAQGHGEFHRTMKYLVERNDPILRGKAREVSDIKSKEIKAVINKMKKALHAEEDGVAIAAPQVGESLRIFIIKRRVEVGDLIFINPEIVKVSRKKSRVEEGCLSLRYLYGSVNRHEKVVLDALDETGKKINVGARGLLAQIFQHEVDHLNGILFTDKAENVRDLPPNGEN